MVRRSFIVLNKTFCIFTPHNTSEVKSGLTILGMDFFVVAIFPKISIRCIIYRLTKNNFNYIKVVWLERSKFSKIETYTNWINSHIQIMYVKQLCSFRWLYYKCIKTTFAWWKQRKRKCLLSDFDALSFIYNVLEWMCKLYTESVCLLHFAITIHSINKY